MLFYSFILYGLAGYLNALTILSLNTTTGVHTGNISNIYMHFINNQYKLSFELLFYVLIFITGSAIVGYFTRHKIQFKLRMNQFAGIHIMTAFFLLFAHQFNWSRYAISSIISLRMGMQNAFPVTTPNKRIRTTSLTGLITELGIKIGGIAQTKYKKEIEALFFNFMYLAAFSIGVIISAFLYYKVSLRVNVLFISIIELLTAIYCLYTGTLKNNKKHH